MKYKIVLWKYRIFMPNTEGNARVRIHAASVKSHTKQAARSKTVVFIFSFYWKPGESSYPKKNPGETSFIPKYHTVSTLAQVKIQ